MQTQPISAASYSRTQSLARVAERFYADEPMALVRNGLSTDLLCAPSDMFMLRKNTLMEKIHDAMEYSTAFTDVEEINALQYLPVRSDVPNYYLTLGLFLYFEDEVGSKAPGRSFQAALRDARMSLEIDDKPDSDKLYERCIKALDSLGMNEPKYRDILKEWKEKGTYTLEGEAHLEREDGSASGTYAELARQICQRQKYLGLNLAVSYALGNKSNVVNERGIDIARQAVKFPAITGNRIQEGSNKREELIITKMLEALSGTSYAEALSAKNTSLAKAKDLLAWVPDAALEILDRERYIFSYADAPTIGSVYPKEDLPGLSHDVEKDVRRNKGQWLQRYRTIFLSNGYREKEDDLNADPNLKAQTAGQTLLHEVMHMAVSVLEPSKKAALKAEIKELSELLKKHKQDLPAYFSERLHTIDSNSLYEVLDMNSRLYSNYSNKWEEVACNMYGLMHTEFSAQGISADTKVFTRPPQGLEKIAQISQHIDALVDEARATIRANPMYTAGEDRVLEAKLSRQGR